MQSLVWLLAASGVLSNANPATTHARGPLLAEPVASYDPVPASASAAQRPRAIEYSQGFYTRLEIHRIASYAILPLFLSEFYLGEKLYSETNGGAQASQSLRSWHGAVADGIGALFLVNTVTGLWNFPESMKNPKGTTRRWVHAGLMMLSDAGFAETAQLAPGRRDIMGVAGGNVNKRSDHRTLAELSMSTALVGYLTMLLWRH